MYMIQALLSAFLLPLPSPQVLDPSRRVSLDYIAFH
jgi:hypothetical protein